LTDDERAARLSTHRVHRPLQSSRIAAAGRHPRETIMKKTAADSAQVTELLLQALETELGGVNVYETAVRCAVNEDLRKEWGEYLSETRHHVQVLQRVFEALELDTEADSPGRRVVRHQGESLVEAMEMALADGEPAAAQLVACECVVLAETKDHTNWELIGHVGKNGTGDVAKVLKAAYEEVEDDEDHHLYHTKGWARELWIESLGFPAVLPPPEEVKQVETAIGAARAEQQRGQMRKGH
jgi:ferritin-like metal-binding protein YciE